MPLLQIISYGRYTGWNSDSRALPELADLSDRLPAEQDMEFGMIVEIRKAKGLFLSYTIEHPLIPGKNGGILPPFTGEYQIRTNPAMFFLGDVIVPPLEEKKGEWKLAVSYKNSILAEKILTIY